jgi:glutamate-1-semialdehyde 2,1-aminomutase
MAAGLAQLELCAADDFYINQAQRTQQFVDSINSFALAQQYPMELVCVGSVFWFSFNGKKRITAADQIDGDMTSFNFMHHYLLNVGVYFGPSGYEVGFVSSAHTDAQLAFTAEQIKTALAAFYQK